MVVKKRTEADWAELKTFAVLARNGTLSAAARALNVDHATIGRRIKSLESTLGVQLVQRRPEGYTLTTAGQEVLGVAARMESASAGLAQLGDGLPHGQVRIAVSPSVCDGFLAMRMVELNRLHPLVDISLISGLRPLSLARHEADIAIRLGRLTDSEIVGRRIASLRLGIFASVERAATAEKESRPPIITFDETNAHLPEAQAATTHFGESRVVFRASSQLAQARAAADGLGLAILPWFVARQFASLQPVCRHMSLPSRDLWLLSRRADQKLWPIGSVRDFLIDLFVRERATFER